MTKIIHLTSAHPRSDTRIFIKQCQSLARAGHDVTLVVADGSGDETINGVNIKDVGKHKGWFNRIFMSTIRVYRKAIDLKGEIYHLHDPELLLIALLLKGVDRKVLFDAHEDLPKQILGKAHLNKFLLVLLSKLSSIVEQLICSRIDGVIAATPAIAIKFRKINPICIELNNYPIIGELYDEGNVSQKSNQICFVGYLNRIRGVSELVKAMAETNTGTRLKLVGSFSEQDFYSELKSELGWDYVDERGFLGRDEIRAIFSDSLAGIVTFHPLPNHIEAQPNKLFEYMSAGLAVIASNFPLWEEIVLGNRCGICVDPESSSQIADAIRFISENPEIAEEMGDNGRRAVREKFNWDNEETKLFEFYSTLLLNSNPSSNGVNRQGVK